MGSTTYTLQHQCRTTKWKFTSKENIALHYLIVRKYHGPRKENSIDYIKQHLEEFPGTSVWVLHVTLGKRWLKGQKYSVEVTCTGLGKFEFRAFDQKKEGQAFEIHSSIFRK